MAQCNCNPIENNILVIYTYNNKLKMCCYHYYLHLTEPFCNIALEIRYQDTLSYKNTISLLYQEKIILLNKMEFNRKNFNNALPHFNITLKFLNITVTETETQTVEKRYSILSKEHHMICKKKYDLEAENDNLYCELEETKKQLNKKDMLNKRLIDTLMLYRYKEFDNTITYDYNEIKQKIKH